MKIWYCAFTSFIFLIVFWLFAYGFLKSVDHIKNSSIEVKIVTEINEEVQKNESYSEVFRNIKVRHHVPKFMLELYEKSKMVKKENLKIGPDIVRSIVPAYGGTHHSNLLENDVNNDHHLLLFKVPNSSKDETFLRAELQILTLIEIKSTLTLGIEREIKISLYNETTSELKILEEKHIYHTDNTWISFNVSQVVQSAILSNHKVLKLVISVKLYQPFISNQSGVLKLSLMPIEENFEHDYPVLLLFYSSEKFQTGKEKIEDLNEEKEVIRKRRYADEDYEEETNKIWDEEGSKMNKKLRRMRNNCRRRPLYVDFAEIGYDSWIVQPNGYEAYQCAGKCFYPVAEHLSPTKHAIVQALLHSVSPSRAPRSCCVPTKLDSISVLYVDAHGVLTYRYAYKDMVVTDCGCR